MVLSLRVLFMTCLFIDQGFFQLIGVLQHLDTLSLALHGKMALETSFGR